MMEKEPQPDSLSNVTVKEYSASEVYSTEPPPAYQRPQQATAVQVARIIAYTVVLMSVVLGAFMLASAYVQANASCDHLQQELMLLQEVIDRYQPPEALIQEEPIAEQSKTNYQQAVKHEPENTTKAHAANEEESEDNSLDTDSDEGSDEEADERTPIQFKLPLQLDFDELAGALMEKNQRSRMNCIVEKKRADEVIDHQPRTVRLPFGLNLTTDPRYEHVTGEKMAIYCESGNEQRHAQPQPDEVMMHVQPIIVPLGGPMPVQMHFNGPQQPSAMPPQPVQQQPRPPMIPAHIIAQHIAQVQRIAAAHQASQQHQQPEGPQYHQQMMHELPHPVPPQHMPNMANMHPQVSIVQQPPHMGQPPVAPHQQIRIPLPEALFAHGQRLPIPEEILTQINRLPNEDVIAIHVSEESDESPEQEQENTDHHQNRIMQEPRQHAQEMNGRQTYARGLPVHIPVPLMQEVQQPAPEQLRPHYLQPRSIRSVDNTPLHREKRVKRCSCDCAC